MSHAVRQVTPCVIVDLPHIWTPWVKATLIGADENVIVATPDLASLRNSKSMIEVIRSDYIVTARAKGLAERPVILKHVLKNAFIPVVTLLGPMFAAVGTGSFFVESIFRVPGMGRFFVLSMTGRDYPMIMGVVLLYGAFLAIMNLAVDLLYGVIDPRIRY